MQGWMINCIKSDGDSGEEEGENTHGEGDTLAGFWWKNIAWTQSGRQRGF